jgi:hypothetical protein
MFLIRPILWFFQALNIGAFIFMQWNAGKFTDRSYILFAICSMLGAGATAVDGAIGHAWGTAATQGFFAIFFLFGIAKRYWLMTQKPK